jgi:hypothetical protein
VDRANAVAEFDDADETAMLSRQALSSGFQVAGVFSRIF